MFLFLFMGYLAEQKQENKLNSKNNNHEKCPLVYPYHFKKDIFGKEENDRSEQTGDN